jgi:acyl carrier protein
MLGDELIAAIAEWDPLSAGLVRRDTPLITSDRLDSLNLVRLMLWIEEKVRSEIDITTIDIARQWDTVDAIVEFVEQARAHQ